MRHGSKYLFTLTIFLAGLLSLSAQVQVQQADVVQAGINLRLANASVLQYVAVPAHAAGTFVVRFDGTCRSDSGDRIILAASHDRSWTVNDGNVPIQTPNNITHTRSFSHTRTYTVPAGTDTFFALGQNSIETGGSGVATVYGSLTVEFWPAIGPAVPSSDFVWHGDLSGPTQRIDTILVPAAPAGKVLLHVDGHSDSDPGDRLVVTANNSPSWLVGAGCVSIMTYNSAQRNNPYTHSRVRSVSGNPNTFYVMGDNVVNQGGSGIADMYGNLSAEFFPSGGAATLDNTEMSYQGLHVRAATLALDSITITPAAAGYALVIFDGTVTSTTGDAIRLAASNDGNWYPNAGNATVSARYSTNTLNIFSHSRLYPVTAGAHTFYGVAQNTGDTAGTGIIYIDATLVVKYYPAVGVGIEDLTAINMFDIYPNPAAGYLIVYNAATHIDQSIILYDLSGRAVLTQSATSAETRIDISSLPAGMYIVRMGDHVRKLVKQ